MYQRENLVGLDHAPKLGPHALKGGLDVVVPDNKIDLQIIKPGLMMNINGMLKQYNITRSLGALVSLTTSFAPFGRSGLVTQNLTHMLRCVRLR